MLKRLVTTVLAVLAAAASSAALGQTSPPPTLQGTFLPDASVPTMIAPAQYGATYFVLNQDLSQIRHSTGSTFGNISCAAPSGFNGASSTPRTFLTDDSSTYTTAQSSSAPGIAANGTNYGSSVCTNGVPLALTGNAPTQTLASNDPRHGRYFVVSAFSGASPDLITVFNNLNTNTGSTPTLSQLNRTSLDTGAQYTSVVTDVASTYGLTAITELKTSTSPGNLWVYSPGINTAFKILGPNGVALPAIGSFIIPPRNDGGGSLLVLVNQDGLTASNLSSPPQDTIPFTIIDLGQLQRTFASVVASGSTITLPFVTQIKATTSFYAMLGAAYNPVTHLVYGVVGGGNGTSVTENVISYDPRSPASPSETVVADVSNVPLTFGIYPQLALDAASGTLQILTSSPTGLYSVGINGTGNTATAVTGTPFPDSNFKPTFISANPLAGETYVASASQVDILTKPTAAPYRATIDIDGPDTALANQSYGLYAHVLYPVADTALVGAPVTITATPATGTAFTYSTSTVGNYAGTYSYVSGQFPSAGVYTLVASVPATANYPAFSSLPISVTVGATTNPGVYPTSLTLSVPSSSTSTSVSATVTLMGSTYAPTGRIVITDAGNAEVGRITLSGKPITIPMSVTLTLPLGSSTLKAVYNGDDQNTTSSSAAVSINVGAALIGTGTTISAPATTTAGATFTATITLKPATTSTTAPTGNVVLTVMSSTGTTGTLTYTAAQALASGGYPAQISINSAGSYTLTASYAGDSNYGASSGSIGITVGPAPAVTPTITLTLPFSAQTPGSVPGSILCSETSAATPTGSIILTGTATSGTKVTLATYSAATYCGKNTLPSSISFAAPASTTYAVQATYAGDVSFNAASSNVQTIIITSAGPTTTTLGLSAVATASRGVPFLVTATLRPATTPSAPATGNVIISGTASGVTAVYATVSATDAIAGKQVSITLPTVDAYTLTAVYAGDSNYGPSTATIGVNVTLAKPTITLNGPATGEAYYVLATYLAGAAGTPGGNITVSAALNGSTAAPLTTVIAASSAAMNSGTVNNTSFNFTTSGTYTITASYPGDANNSAVTSTTSLSVLITLPVVGTGFKLAFANPDVDLSAGLSTPVEVQYNTLEGGGDAKVGITLTALAGFSSPVTLTLSGIPKSIDSAFLDASGATISSAIPVAAGTHVTLHLTNNQYASVTMPGQTSNVAYACGLLGAFSLALWRKRKQFTRLSALLGVLCIVFGGGVLLSGCGADKTKQHVVVTVTATPVNVSPTTPPQSIQFLLVYYVPTASLAN